MLLFFLDNLEFFSFIKPNATIIEFLTFKINFSKEIYVELIYIYFLNINNIYIYYNKSFIYGIKFCLTILFLIFIRAGIPRYRYDYLTILGWNRFFFITSIVLILVVFVYFLI